MLKETREYIPTMPPDLALRITLISSNFPCLELLFVVPKVFKLESSAVIFNLFIYVNVLENV